jgi:hypothetical protein
MNSTTQYEHRDTVSYEVVSDGKGARLRIVWDGPANGHKSYEGWAFAFALPAEKREQLIKDLEATR